MIAAIVTPTPDVVNQLMMAIPLVVLYEISIVAVWIFGRKVLPGFAQDENLPETVDAPEDISPEK